MKLAAYFFLILLCTPLAAAIPEIEPEKAEDVVTKMDALIAATKASIKRQEALRDLLVQFKESEKKAILNPDDTDNLLQLVTLARQVKESINANFLQDYFSPQFIEELNTLSNISAKKNIPPAK